jgi:hypothetical protein
VFIEIPHFRAKLFDGKRWTVEYGKVWHQPAGRDTAHHVEILTGGELFIRAVADIVAAGRPVQPRRRRLAHDPAEHSNQAGDEHCADRGDQPPQWPEWLVSGRRRDG